MYLVFVSDKATMSTPRTLCIFLLLLATVIQIVHSRRYFRGYRRRDCTTRNGFIMANLGDCSFKLKSRGCYGECLSSVQPFLHKIGLASSCSCCAPIKIMMKKKTLKCAKSNQIEDIRYPVAMMCACRPCSWIKRIEN